MIQRWIEAFDEIDCIDSYEKKVVSVKYANTFRYDLRDYESGKIKAGGKMMIGKPKENNNFHEYGFNSSGFPVINRFRHNWNKIDWAGFYKKEEQLIEYSEFCLTTKIPSCVQRIVLEKGQKMTFQSLILNGRGSGPAYDETLKEKFIETLITDKFYLIYYIEYFFYENDRITKANGVAFMPGVEEYTYEDIYTYHVNGKPKMIKTYFDNGHSRIKYYKSLEKTPFAQRMSNLSGRIAEAIINYLQNVKTDSPLFSLELTYKIVESYWPSIVLFTEIEKESAIKEGGSPFLPDWMATEYIDIPMLDMENEYQEFFQIIEETENWASATKMLRNAAALLTKSRLNGVLPTTDDFIAYPMDGSLEANELSKILLESGADKSVVKKWKKNGWV